MAILKIKEDPDTRPYAASTHCWRMMYDPASKDVQLDYASVSPEDWEAGLNRLKGKLKNYGVTHKIDDANHRVVIHMRSTRNTVSMLLEDMCSDRQKHSYEEYSDLKNPLFFHTSILNKFTAMVNNEKGPGGNGPNPNEKEEDQSSTQIMQVNGREITRSNQPEKPPTQWSEKSFRPLSPRSPGA